jgi:hypothetical protein
VAAVVAAAPDHVIVLCGLNDSFNHGGSPIPPATTQANLQSFFTTVRASRPNCVFHVVSNMWSASEQWPDGSGPNDALVRATNAGELAACQANPAFAEYLDIRTPIYSISSPLYNPGHASNGVFTQAIDSTHPSKPLGQNILSQTVFKLLTFGV